MIKRIFSDMDGTLLDNRGNVTTTTVNAIKKSRIPITLVSARAPMEMAPAIESLKLKDEQIAFNGGLIFKRDGQHWKYISECYIDISIAGSIVQLLSVRFPDVSVSYYDLTNWYARRIDAGIKYEQELTGQKALVSPHNKVLEQDNLKVFKIMIITFDQAHCRQFTRCLAS